MFRFVLNWKNYLKHFRSWNNFIIQAFCSWKTILFDFYLKVRYIFILMKRFVFKKAIHFWCRPTSSWFKASMSCYGWSGKFKVLAWGWTSCESWFHGCYHFRKKNSKTVAIVLLSTVPVPWSFSAWLNQVLFTKKEKIFDMNRHNSS